MRYLANMNVVVSSLSVFAVFAVLAPGMGVAQSGTALPSSGYGAGNPGLEGGSLMPTAAQISSAKPIGMTDLRSVLQLQKARQPEAAQPERQLSTQERNELRQQLRQQREAVSASN